MNNAQPPQWMQRTLLLFLRKQDRETIAGDLLEEYREERYPRLGALRADLWYIRQLASFVNMSFLGGVLVKQALILMSFLVAAAGIWLGVMENVLKHNGYAGRSAIAVCIAMQGMATLLFLSKKNSFAFRNILLCGSLAVVFLGTSAIIRILRASHFEGFVLFIGSALVVQGALTCATLLQREQSGAA